MKTDPGKKTFMERTHGAEPATVEATPITGEYHEQGDETDHGKTNYRPEVAADNDKG